MQIDGIENPRITCRYAVLFPAFLVDGLAADECQKNRLIDEQHQILVKSLEKQACLHKGMHHMRRGIFACCEKSDEAVETFWIPSAVACPALSTFETAVETEPVATTVAA